MERVLIYRMPGVVTVGRYLMGHHKLPEAIRLKRVLVDARTNGGAGGGVTELALEANGVETGVRVLVTSPGGSNGVQVSVDIRTRVTVAANAVLRWRVVSAPAPELGVSEMGVTLVYGTPRLETVRDAVLYVQWVRGSERLMLYRYDAGTGVFTLAAAGLNAGRATVVGGDDFSVTFASTGAGMQARESDLHFKQLADNGNTGTADRSGQVEFWIETHGESKRVGTLMTNGTLMVARAEETGNMATVPEGADRFVMKSGGEVRAVLGLPGLGLVAGRLVEE